MGSTKIKLAYENVAITQAEDAPRKKTYMLDEQGDLLSFEYNDNADGQVDDLEIVVRDREGLWCKEWRPQLGAKLLASVLPAFGTGELTIGPMYIDSIEIGAPPQIVTIRATSTPVNSEARGTKKTRAWESVTFEQMAEKIAKEGGFNLYYKGATVEIERVDQHEETDLELLNRLGDDYGFVVKVADGKIVVYDQELLEAADPVAVVPVSTGDGMVKSWRVTAKTRDVYSSARVLYRNPIHKLVSEALKNHPEKELSEPVNVPLKPRGRHRRLTNEQRKQQEKDRQAKHDAAFAKKEDQYLDSLMRQARDEERKAPEQVEVDDVELLFTPAGVPIVGSVLQIEKRVKDEAEAQRLAERKLRDANKRAVELTLDLVGDAVMRASQNIMLVGAGDFSGKYHIDQATHRVQSGYGTSVTAHRVLSYR